MTTAGPPRGRHGGKGGRHQPSAFHFQGHAGVTAVGPRAPRGNRRGEEVKRGRTARIRGVASSMNDWQLMSAPAAMSAATWKGVRARVGLHGSVSGFSGRISGQRGRFAEGGWGLTADADPSPAATCSGVSPAQRLPVQLATQPRERSVQIVSKEANTFQGMIVTGIIGNFPAGKQRRSHWAGASRGAQALLLRDRCSPAASATSISALARISLSTSFASFSPAAPCSSVHGMLPT